MPKLDLTTVSGGFYSQEQLNANFESIRQLSDNVLARNGTVPNHMEADLDMNSNDILNVNNLYTDNLILAGSTTLPVLVSRSQEVQTPGAGVATLTTNPYYVGNDSLEIYIDGIKQIVDIDYTEIGDDGNTSTIVSMTSPFAGTEEVEIIIDATYQKGECANSAIVNWVSLADYICAGDDADTALSNAIADACANGRALYAPAGTYTFSSPGIITNCNISIFGDGPGLSIFIFDNCDGLIFNYTTTDHFRASVSDLTILQEQEAVNRAITLNNTSGTTGQGYHNLVNNVDFMYRNPAAGNFTNHCWKTAIEITGISEGSIANCICLSNKTTADVAFIKFTDTESSFRWSISGNTIGWVEKGIWFDTAPGKFHESIIVSDNDFADLDYAVYHTYATGDSNVQHLDFNNNSIRHAKHGLYASALLPNVHDNIFIHEQTVHSSTPGQYSNVYLFGESINGLVHDNQLGTDNGGAYNVNAITIDGTEVASIKYIKVHDNVINYAFVGIQIQNNVEACKWGSQMFGADVTTQINDTTTTSDRNYHLNGDSTHYRTDSVVDITTAISIPTAYQIPFTYFDNSKDELDLTPVTTNVVTIPDFISRIRVSAVSIIRSDAVPAGGTTLNLNIMATGADGDPLPVIVGAMELPAPANGDFQTLVASAATLNVVPGATVYVRVWSSVALAKSTIRGDLFIESVS